MVGTDVLRTTDGTGDTVVVLTGTPACMNVHRALAPCRPQAPPFAIVMAGSLSTIVNEK
jgi:hypothetical protein